MSCRCMLRGRYEFDVLDAVLCHAQFTAKCNSDLIIARIASIFAVYAERNAIVFRTFRVKILLTDVIGTPNTAVVTKLILRRARLCGKSSGARKDRRRHGSRVRRYAVFWNE